MDYIIDILKKEYIDSAAILEKENFGLDAWSSNSLMETLENSDYHYIVAIDNNNVIGMCGYLRSFDEADIMNVSVKKEYRGKKIANTLMNQLLEYGHSAGINHFTLEVRKENTPARKLYENLGFICEGIRPRFYKNPDDDAAIYWLHL